MTPEEAQGIFRAYRLTFRSPSGMEALDELMTFCRFRVDLNDDGPVDPHKVLIMEGRRQAFLHIVQMAQFSDEQLIRIFARNWRPTPEELNAA